MGPSIPFVPSIMSVQPMPQTSPGLLSGSKYQSIFDSALESYEKETGKELTLNPLFCKIEACKSPDGVITLLREQIPGFDRSRSGNDSERLSNWLDPTVNAINTFSGTIGWSVFLVHLRTFDFDSSRIWTLVLFYTVGIPSCGGDLYRHRRPSVGELHEHITIPIDSFSRVIATSGSFRLLRLFAVVEGHLLNSLSASKTSLGGWITILSSPDRWNGGCYCEAPG
jgi:hypothetical protein